MTVKEWLNRARHINTEIKQLQETKEILYNKLISTTGSTTAEKVQHSNTGAEEDKRIKYIEYCQKLEELVCTLFEVKKELTDFMEQLSDVRYKIILRSYFIALKTFGQIAEFMEYSERQTIRLYKEALAEAEEVYNKNVKIC